MKATRTLLCALLVALAATVASCGDSTPTAPQPDVTPNPELLGSLGARLGLLRCAPLPYDSVTQTVGWAGGTIRVGPHVLTIPAGALRNAVTITAVTAPDSVNAVRFGPAGLTFDRPAALTLSYANCGLIARLFPKHIAYTSDDLRILELLPSLDILSLQKVSAPLRHFSVYAVAW